MRPTTVRIEGADDLMKALRQMGDRAKHEARQAVKATAIEIRGDIIRRYQQGPKTGEVYGRGGVTHRASAPGEAPATDTGRLASSVVYRASWAVNVPGFEGSMTAEVSTAVEYGAYLEFGTYDKRIAPRPAWRPAVQDAAPKFRERLEAALRRAGAR